MSTTPKELHTSDGESGEKPLRERLRNTKIAQDKNASKAAETSATLQPEPQKSQGKLHRKRSHEDVDATEQEPAHESRPARKSKRSRENSPEDKVVEQTTKRKSSELERSDKTATMDVSEPSTAPTSVTTATGHDKSIKSDESPKSKRSKVDDKADTLADAAPDAEPTIESESNETKTSTIKIPPGSGFANTSAASPFASLAASKSPSEQPQTSGSAFASSAFGALAGSSTSAFGALGQSKLLSSFASPGDTPAPAEDSTKPAPSAFGSKPLGASPFAAAGSSGFGSGASGFGALGNGLSGGFGALGGSKLTSFASSGTPGVIGSTKTGTKAFGAPGDEEDQSGGEEDNDAKAKSPKPVEEDKKDERFFEREMETGEENETTDYQCRAKLYGFVDKKEWKERGLGVLRLNVYNPKPDDDSTTLRARLVMRADNTHKVILNTPIQKGLKFGTVTGDRPVGGYMYLLASVEVKGEEETETKIELLQLKARQQFALELWDHITDLQKQM